MCERARAYLGSSSYRMLTVKELKFFLVTIIKMSSALSLALVT